MQDVHRLNRSTILPKNLPSSKSWSTELSTKIDFSMMTKVHNRCILPLQQNLSSSQSKELKTRSFDMEVEKLNELPNFESKEDDASVAEEIQAEEESETQKDSEVVIEKHSFVEKVGS